MVDFTDKKISNKPKELEISEAIHEHRKDEKV
jgi:hypothetical protein